MSDSRQDGDGTPTGEATATEAVDVAEAARRLGVTPDAIRSRLHRGTLEGEKVEGQWRVRLPVEEMSQFVASEPTGGQQASDRQPTGNESNRQDASDGTDRTRQGAATVDIAPLVAEIARLSSRNEELAAAAGMWQARAHHLEEQLQQLTATAESAGDAPDEAVSGPASDENADHDVGEGEAETVAPEATQRLGMWARLRRWIAGEE